MNCTNCTTLLIPGEQFCGSCGTEVTNATAAPTVVAPAAANDAVASPAPVGVPTVSSAPVVVTLSFGGKDFPLSDGGKLIIARADTDKCVPDIGITAETVSSTPVEVTATGGKVTVKDTGTSLGIRVVKYLKPGESFDVAAGDMIMLGDQLVNIG